MFTRYKKFKVIDNFISKTYQDELLKGVGAPSTAWLYQPNMDYGPEDARENPGITNTVAFEQATDDKYSQFVLEILGMGNIQNHALFYALLGLTCKITDDLIPSHRGYRIRGIHQTPIPNPPLHYIPHTDCQESKNDVWSAIYYLNDATGDTFLFEEQIDDVSMSDRRTHKWKPVDQVSPKKGRLILFPARQYHAGSPPKKDMRMLINFNFSMPADTYVDQIRQNMPQFPSGDPR
tara:strand:- start:1946 stop:2650 length:705 start_codon:yes stop_codon:yes gene_type:complete